MRKILVQSEALKVTGENVQGTARTAPRSHAKDFGFHPMNISGRLICFSCGKRNGRGKRESQGGNGEINQEATAGEIGGSELEPG